MQWDQFLKCPKRVRLFCPWFLTKLGELWRVELGDQEASAVGLGIAAQIQGKTPAHDSTMCVFFQRKDLEILGLEGSVNQPSQS